MAVELCFSVYIASIIPMKFLFKAIHVLCMYISIDIMGKLLPHHSYLDSFGL